MWSQLFWPGMAFLATTLAALAFRSALFAGFRRWAGEASGPGGFVAAIRVPSLLWCVVLGLAVGVASVELPPRLARQLGTVLEAAIILSVTLTLAGILASLVAAASERAMGGGVTGAARAAVRLVVIVLGLLVLLSSLGIHITPILTALGVGGLAVALALQDTLSNLFAGMHLLADKPIRVGDYVKVAEGVEGHVLDVGWRSTRLRTLNNNTVILPNQKVAQSIITNYDMPESRIALPVRVAVEYGTDADHLEDVLLDEGTRATKEITGFLAHPAPVVRLGFGESSLEATLVCHVGSFIDQFAAQHELRKRLLHRFRAESIRLAYPVRTLRFEPPDGDRLSRAPSSRADRPS
jgi:small-conductance mechanosensitive channel